MQKKSVDVVGLGYNSVDFICRLPSFPKINTKLSVQDSVKQGGGQVATALAALARWNVSTVYIGSIGGDENGVFSLNSLQSEGVDTSSVVLKKKCTTQFAVILVSGAQGERTILWKRDPAINLRPRDFKKQDVVQGKILHVDGHEIEAAVKAAKWAVQTKQKVVFDAEKIFPKTEELISLTHSLITSEEFPVRFTGITNKKKALQKLHSLGPEYVAMTLGEKGALGYDGKRFYRIPGEPVDIVDTTGAGDVFHAGYIYGLLQEWSFSDTLRFANMAAALKCRSVGGRQGIAPLREIMRCLHKKT